MKKQSILIDGELENFFSSEGILAIFVMMILMSIFVGVFLQ
ncbi:MAG: hypothetical protein O0X93_08740 [Methanocorpusculum sp.]|uniref:DUF3149 domain-containing protein n=1 Tax=Methanocorpusculum petauri TaxID=3002863 RepID=A0ABT4IDA4_9EURY|nr:hypothetical protein [Methanocorpusculum petauri]MCZ9312738.1 hypothetical protein [Methanocorpusculum sp.]MCZ0859721.1 hypothetical protein [Methanocorpusculum petauri]MDE2444374.1 hypothetical protein [Methanocorpusculum sp.]MDE2519605.1 hypothetical protein [Methanocorpusculum sp.]MDE2523225.1 hypothetical protein [Methanocorpusculum sp.]